jgi:hypothetical protein
MARAILHNSNYESVDACRGAIDRYFAERIGPFWSIRGGRVRRFGARSGSRPSLGREIIAKTRVGGRQCEATRSLRFSNTTPITQGPSAIGCCAIAVQHPLPEWVRLGRPDLPAATFPESGHRDSLPPHSSPNAPGPAPTTPTPSNGARRSEANKRRQGRTVQKDGAFSAGGGHTDRGIATPSQVRTCKCRPSFNSTF